MIKPVRALFGKSRSDQLVDLLRDLSKAAMDGASSTIFGASMYGIPLSTTHTITSAIVGVGAARRSSDVNWGVLGKIVLDWPVTFPVCATLAYFAALFANATWPS